MVAVFAVWLGWWYRGRGERARDHGHVDVCLDVSRRAARHIAASGSQVYVWGEGGGGAFASLRASLERPLSGSFEPASTNAPFELFVERGIAPSRLTVRLGLNGRLSISGAVDDPGGGGG